MTVPEIEVPDYSDSIPHTQTRQVEARALEKGDYIIIPHVQHSTMAQQYGLISGPTYEVSLSAPTRFEPGWVVMAFGGDMVTFRVQPFELFHIRLVHEPASCGYCVARFEASQRAAGVEPHIAQAKAVLNGLGLCAYNRDSEGNLIMRENGAG